MEGEEDKVPILKFLIKFLSLFQESRRIGPKVNYTIGSSESACTNMANLLGCSDKGLLNEYLGLPFGGSPWSREFWDLVVGRCRKLRTDGKPITFSWGGERH